MHTKVHHGARKLADEQREAVPSAMHGPLHGIVESDFAGTPEAHAGRDAVFWNGRWIRTGTIVLLISFRFFL